MATIANSTDNIATPVLSIEQLQAIKAQVDALEKKRATFQQKVDLIEKLKADRAKALGYHTDPTKAVNLLNSFGQMQQMMKKRGKFQKMMAKMGGGGMPGFRR